jgi:hypothetical protein
MRTLMVLDPTRAILDPDSGVQPRNFRIGRQVKQRRGIFMGAAKDEVGFVDFPDSLCAAMGANYAHGGSIEKTDAPRRRVLNNDERPLAPRYQTLQFPGAGFLQASDFA